MNQNTQMLRKDPAEQNKVEELLQTEPQDTDLTASFLLDHQNPLEPIPVPYQSLFSTLNMATQNQPVNNGTQNNGIKELGINKPTPFTGEKNESKLVH